LLRVVKVGRGQQSSQLVSLSFSSNRVSSTCTIAATNYKHEHETLQANARTDTGGGEGGAAPPGGLGASQMYPPPYTKPPLPVPPPPPPPPPPVDVAVYVPRDGFGFSGTMAVVVGGHLNGGPVATRRATQDAFATSTQHSLYNELATVGAGVSSAPRGYYRQASGSDVQRAREAEPGLPLHQLLEGIERAVCSADGVYFVPQPLLGDRWFGNFYTAGSSFLDAHAHGTGGAVRLPSLAGNIGTCQAMAAGLYYVQVCQLTPGPVD
jgi:hypothetical protein